MIRLLKRQNVNFCRLKLEIGDYCWVAVPRSVLNHDVLAKLPSIVCIRMYVCMCIHTHTHTHIACTHTYVHTYVHACMHSYTCTGM